MNMGVGPYLGKGSSASGKEQTCHSSLRRMRRVTVVVCVLCLLVTATFWWHSRDELPHFMRSGKGKRLSSTVTTFTLNKQFAQLVEEARLELGNNPEWSGYGYLYKGPEFRIAISDGTLGNVLTGGAWRPPGPKGVVALIREEPTWIDRMLTKIGYYPKDSGWVSTGGP